jgi:hypothetical protein
VFPAPVDCEIHGQAYEIEAVWRKNSQDYWWMGVCNNCHEPVLVLRDGWRIFPVPQPSPTDERIPKKIRNDLIEAKISFSVDAFRACAVMARRSIQSTCLDKGASNNDLVVQIEELTTKGIITKDLRDWATAVRWVGNDAAHPASAEVTKHDAEDILKLAEQFLHVIYVAPAIAKELATKKGKKL